MFCRFTYTEFPKSFSEGKLAQLSKMNRLKKSLTGLANLGNTCYINSAVQCLCNTYSFSRFFRKAFSIQESNSDDLLMHFQVLVKVLWKGRGAFEPVEFVEGVFRRWPDFKPGTQQDAQEFLRLFLDYLDTTSIVTETFRGKIENQITCKNCNTVHKLTEDFFDLPVCIPNKKELEHIESCPEQLMDEADRSSYHKKSSSVFNSFKKMINKDWGKLLSLYDCLESHFYPQELNEEGNLYYCSRCNGKHHSSQTYKIKDFPNTLIIVLKRFRYAYWGSKISTHVQLPMSLTLDKFSAEKPSPEYSLTGVIHHRGGLWRGHYIAYCKHPKSGTWYEYNDHKVRECTEEDVLSAKAYIAFYSQNSKERQPLGQGKDFYIPLKWVNKYKTLAVPGPVTMESVLCSHNNLAVEGNQVLGISSETWNYLSQEFGVQGTQLKSCQPCRVCALLLEKVEFRLRREKEIIRQLDEAANKQGLWFCISVNWANKWRRFVNSNTKLPYELELPGPVDNSDLLSQGKPRKGLVVPKDYIVVRGDVWEGLNILHGTKFAIAVLEPNIYSEPANPEQTSFLETEVLDELQKIKELL